MRLRWRAPPCSSTSGQRCRDVARARTVPCGYRPRHRHHRRSSGRRGCCGPAESTLRASTPAPSGYRPFRGSAPARPTPSGARGRPRRVAWPRCYWPCSRSARPAGPSAAALMAVPLVPAWPSPNVCVARSSADAPVRAAHPLAPSCLARTGCLGCDAAGVSATHRTQATGESGVSQHAGDIAIFLRFRTEAPVARRRRDGSIGELRS